MLALVSVSVLMHPLVDPHELYDALRECGRRARVGLLVVGQRDYIRPPTPETLQMSPHAIIKIWGGRALPWLFTQLQVPDMYPGRLGTNIGAMLTEVSASTAQAGRERLWAGVSFTHTRRTPSLAQWGIENGVGVEQLALGLDVPNDSQQLARAIVGSAAAAADVLF